MKFIKLGIISFMMLNYFALGCATTPRQLSDIPSKSLSKFDQELFTRAIFHQKKGQIKPAIVLWERFLQKKPNSFSAKYNLGLLYYANDDVTRAIYYFEQGLKLRPVEVQLKINLVRALKVQSAIFEENMEYNEAIVDLRKIIQLAPVEEREAFERQVEALEDQVFEQVKKSNTMKEYQEFLKKYPQSIGNSDEARLWIENKLQGEKINN
jgi:tetratricopeptide (TPR) repeat protein